MKTKNKKLIRMFTTAVMAVTIVVSQGGMLILPQTALAVTADGINIEADTIVVEESAPVIGETIVEEVIVEESVVEGRPVVEEVVNEELVTEEVVIEDPIVEEVVEEVVIEEVVEETVVVNSTSNESVQAPELTTDKDDYAPTDNVTIFGKFFQSFYALMLKIVGGFPDGSSQVTHEDQVVTDENGEFTYQYQLDGVYRPNYTVEALDSLTGGLLALTSFTDAPPAANLDQLRNGSASSPDEPPVWANGNLGSQTAHYVEGYSVAYRTVMTNLPTGTPITLTLGYDIKHSDRHALDYLTHYNRIGGPPPSDPDHSTVFGHGAETINPLAGVSGVSGTTDIEPIPVPDTTNSPAPGQPATSWDNLPVGEKLMTLFGGNITSVVYNTQGDLTASNSETTIDVTFTVGSSTAVLAWGGHIGSRADWGFDGIVPRSAGGISGSPYHMRLKGWTLNNLGNQDRSLSAVAVYAPPQEGNIIIDKVTVPASDPQLFTFNPSYGGSFQLADATTPNDSGPLVAGVYSISETVPTGWDQTSAVCSDGSPINAIDLQAEEIITCTFTNSKLPTLTLQKTVTNDNGGTAVANNFQGKIDGNNVPWGVAQTLTPGSYTASETVVSNYTASTWDTDCAANGSVTLAYGDNKVCSITNNDNAPSLVLNKIVVNDDGGTAVASDWTLTASGPTGFSGAGPSVSNGVSFDAGTYNLSESGPSGYSASDWVCVGVTQDDADTITLGLGESATCTITNNDIAPTLKLVKSVTNDDGGSATPADWDLTADGPFGDDFTDSGNSVTFHTVTAGAGYDLSESSVPGYTAGSWSCDVGSLVGNVVILSVAQNATCTITNDDQAAHLIIIKNVINDNGGTKTVGDFSGNISGVTVAGGNTWVGTVDPGVNKTLSTVGIYSVIENADSDYSILYSADCSGTIALGETKTCTVTNDDIAPTLKLVKSVTNDNGGSAVPSDWTLTATGDSGFSDSGDSVTFHAVKANEAYNLSESSVPGYTEGSWSCDGGSLVDGAVTLGLNEDVTCTITNDDQQAYITVVKVVVNDNGGTALPDDFLLTLDGNGVTSGVAVPVDPGTYTADETVVFGYAFEGFSGDCDVNGDVTVALGESKTCTLTNDDIAPQLTVIKHVINDNGGTAVASEWTMDVTATNPSDTGFAGEEDPGTTITLDAGAYSVAESGGPSGYTQTDASADCSGSMAVGETKTCTITNDDNAPSLTLVKEVVNDNGGIATASNWTLTASGPTGFSGAGPSVSNGVSFDAGTYNLSESGPSGYSASDWVCVGGSQNDGDTVTVGLGESATCTIINNDIAPTLTLNKIVVNDNGGTALESAWTLYADGPTPISGAGAAGDADVVSGASFSQGTYDLSESAGPSGYSASDWVCVGGSQNGSEITLGLGESTTCTITNDDQSGHLIVHKVTIPADDLTVFSVTLNDTPVSGNATQDLSTDSDVNYEVNAGSYSVTEAAEAGWDETDNACVDVQVVNGGTSECTITNTQRGHIIIQKNAIPDGSQEFTFNNDFGNGNPATFGLVDDSTPGLPNYNAEVLPGTYAVSEDAVAGWESPESVSCSDGSPIDAIEVSPGETVTCTFVNEKYATIILVKNTIGGDDTFDFVMTGDGLPANDQLATASSTAQETYYDLDADNTYTIEETPVPAGWALTDAVCDNGNPVDDITPNAGEVITCTFTNHKPAAQIDLDPLSAYNEIGDDHVITATVQVHNGDGNWGAAPDDTLVTFSLVNDTASTTFVGGNTCLTSGGSCSVTINSSETGNVDIHAVAGPEVLSVVVNVATDGTGENSADAEKTYVDAKISIDPQEAANAISDEHELTATVMEDDGSGFVVAFGETVTFTVTSGVATFVGGIDTCVTNGSGECSVSIVSNTTGSNTISAEVDANVLGVIVHRETDGTANNSDPADKDYVNARISITPETATNEVNDDHNFVVTVEEDTGSGWVAVLGAIVDVDVVPAPDSLDETDCADGTDGSGQCTATINSTSANVFTATASATIEISGVEFVLVTDGNAPNSGSAEKTYVDASIALSPQEATNDVNDPHTITAHVTQDDGSGVTDVASTTVTFSITSGTATFVGDDNDCVTDGNGECSVDIIDATPGDNVIDATTTFLVGGVSLTRSTNSDSGPDGTDAAEKTYIAGRIIVQKVTVGGDGDFDFTADYDNDGFTLSNGQSDNSGYIPTGNHSVSESVLAGWDLTSAVCDNQDDPSSITLEDGDVVTCTFTNTKRATITIVKDSDPNDTQDFNFSGDLGNFILDDDAGVQDGGDSPTPNFETFVNQVPNQDYTITEGPMPNSYWTFGGVSCIDANQSPYPVVVNGQSATVNPAPGAEITCTFVNHKQSPTRTQGFWKTHTEYTTSIFQNQLGSTIQLGGGTSQEVIDSAAKLFGAWYSGVSQKSTGKGKTAQRSDVDKARMQLAHQWLAAKLNCAAFGCSAATQTLLANASAAYQAGNISAMLSYASQLDTFNNSSDSIVIDGNPGKATPKVSSSIANLAFWDTP